MVIEYSSWSKAYVKHRKARIGFAKTIIKLGNLNKKSKVLEIGAGTGNYCSLIKELTECQIEGIDSSKEMIKKAKQLNKNIQFKVGDALDLPFKEQSFDFIFYFDVIHHTKNLRKCFKEAYRVLKTNGKVCIITNSIKQIKERLYAKYFPTVTRIDLSRYYPILVLRRKLLSTNFKKTKSFHKIIKKRKIIGHSFYLRMKTKSSSVLHYVPKNEFENGLKKLKKDLSKKLSKKVERTFVFTQK